MSMTQMFSRVNPEVWSYAKGVGTPLLILAALAMVVLPLPPLMLDILFTFNITLGLVVLLITIIPESLWISLFSPASFWWLLFCV